MADTSFRAEADKSYKVAIAIDVSTRTWEFSVDGSTFKPANPLPFRAAVDQLDTVRYLCENAPGIDISAVRVLRAGESAAGDPYAGWQTVQGKDEDFEFTLRIPPGWRWAKGKIHQATKQTGVNSSMHFIVGPDRSLLAAKKKLAPAELLKHAVKQAATDAPGMSIIEQRAIKVGDLDAAWVVLHEKPAAKSLPTNLDTLCRLQTSRVEVVLHGGYDDSRAARTAKDFENAQAEFLLIAQSFRVVGGKAGK